MSLVEQARKDLLQKIKDGAVTVQYAQAAMTLYETEAFNKLTQLYSSKEPVTTDAIEQILEKQDDAYMLAWIYDYFQTNHDTPRSASFKNSIRDRIAGIYNTTADLQSP